MAHQRNAPYITTSLPPPGVISDNELQALLEGSSLPGGLMTPVSTVVPPPAGHRQLFQFPQFSPSVSEICSPPVTKNKKRAAESKKTPKTPRKKPVKSQQNSFISPTDSPVSDETGCLPCIPSKKPRRTRALKKAANHLPHTEEANLFPPPSSNKQSVLSQIGRCLAESIDRCLAVTEAVISKSPNKSDILVLQLTQPEGRQVINMFLLS